MTDLNQQLEDKKKGCGKWFEYKNIDGKGTDRKVLCLPSNWTCPQCREIIAILEQAIAEMQKQRQEILDKIRLEFHTFREEFIESELNIEDFDIGNLLYNIEQQLNQPKTEQ